MPSAYVPVYVTGTHANEIIVRVECAWCARMRGQQFSGFLYGKGGTLYVRTLWHFILTRRLFSTVISSALALHCSACRAR